MGCKFMSVGEAFPNIIYLLTALAQERVLWIFRQVHFHCVFNYRHWFLYFYCFDWLLLNRCRVCHSTHYIAYPNRFHIGSINDNWRNLNFVSSHRETSLAQGLCLVDHRGGLLGAVAGLLV